MASSPSNPFRPARGSIPPVHLGHEQILADWVAAIDAGPSGVAGRWLRVSAAGGAGKTGLLRCAAAIAAGRGWRVLSLSARPGIIQRLVRDEFAANHSREMRAGTVTDLGPSIAGLSAELSQRGVGLAVMIDELELADPGEIDHLVAVLEHCSIVDGCNLAVIVAGLPSGFLAMLDHDDRFMAGAVDAALSPLPSEVAREALHRPIIEAGRRIESDALAFGVEVSHGNLAMIQRVGSHAWDFRLEGLTIDLTDVQEAARLASRSIAQVVVEPIVRTLPSELVRFLTSLAVADVEQPLGALAERLLAAVSEPEKAAARLASVGLVTPVAEVRPVEWELVIPWMREHLRATAAAALN